MPRILVEDVRKSFVLRHTHSFKEAFLAAVRRKPTSTSFHALDGVSFSIGEGEAVALLGFNGSGKSTMLKMISGVLRPDTGKVRTRGRVAGLIEVGAGFHPDLSGRENVYLNAAILGMERKEIEARFDEIVAFSEIEKFIDTEVKHYSSGMFLRLAFSVAIHTEQDVLLIDEILSVGDEPFQKKCLARIRSLHQQGKTLVIVSHDLDMVAALCTRGIVLRDGKVAFDGESHEAVEKLRKLGWSPFVDVTHDHPFFEQIVELADRDVLPSYPNGESSREFRPREQITRAVLSESLSTLSGVAPTTLVGDPELVVTRAELARVLYEHADRSGYAAPASSPFHDVELTHPNYTAIAWLGASGISRGWEEGRRLPAFRPDLIVAREELAVFLGRYDKLA